MQRVTGSSASANGPPARQWPLNLPLLRRLAHGPAAIITNLWHWKWVVLGILGALGIATYAGPTALLGPTVTVSAPIRASFVQAVVASGHVEAPFRVDIGAQITGVVADVPVIEGQVVKAGDTLIVLDDQEARALVVQAEGTVAQAEARLRQLRELTLPSAEQTLQQTRAVLQSAQKTFDRVAKLSSNGYASRAALDEATKNFDIAKTQVRNAEYAVFTSSPGGSDYVLAETQLSQTRASLAMTQSRLAYTRIKAPRDGILISRDVERGNVVQPGKVLMKLSPSGATQLVVQIDEKNLSLIHLGQTALASADAYAGSNFQAEVIYLNPGVDLQRASVEVKLRVLEPPEYLREDMTVSVDIEVARRDNAVIVSIADIHDFASGAPWVMTIKGGRTVRQPVRIGLSSGGKAQILDGLSEQDAIVPASAATIKPGQRVRIGQLARDAR
jgi:HlyD family secretion protein